MSDDQRRTLVRVIDMYYNRGMSQAEIGKRLDISRSTVSRLLAKAAEEGYVEIRLNFPPDSSMDLERQLEELYGLGEALVAHPKGGDVAGAVTSLAASHLFHVLHDGMTLAMTRGLAMRGVVSAFERDVRLRFASLENMVVVPLMGAPDLSQNASHEDRLVYSNYLVDEMSRIASCISYDFPAPHHASSAEAARMFANEPSVAQAIALGRTADVAVFGVGGVSADSSIVRSSTSLADAYRLMRAKGAVGEVAGRLFDAQGREMTGGYEDEIVGVDLAALRQIPRRVAVAWGTDKLDAIHASLLGGLETVLVTDRATAEALVERAERK